MPTITVSEDAYDILTAYDEDPDNTAYELDALMAELEAFRRWLDEVAHAAGIDPRDHLDEIPDLHSPMPHLGDALRRAIIEKLKDPIPLDAAAYDCTERDAIQHEPPSRWYRLRHPEV